MITERDRRLLRDIIAIVKPTDSLEARLEKLDGAHREIFDNWKACWDHWFERYKADDRINCEPEARPYARIIDGYGPRLPANVEKILFGDMPRILTTMTDDQAAQLYGRYSDAQRR
jgi:hypothetical protein